jgi:hypothetical protein
MKRFSRNPVSNIPEYHRKNGRVLKIALFGLTLDPKQDGEVKWLVVLFGKKA